MEGRCRQIPDERVEQKPKSQVRNRITRLPFCHARETCEVKDNLAPKKVSHLQFGLGSPAEMQRLAEFQVCSGVLFAMPARTPTRGRCLDTRLGVSNKVSTCATCKLKLVNCSGHYRGTFVSCYQSFTLGSSVIGTISMPKNSTHKFNTSVATKCPFPYSPV